MWRSKYFNSVENALTNHEWASNCIWCWRHSPSCWWNISSFNCCHCRFNGSRPMQVPGNAAFHCNQLLHAISCLIINYFRQQSLYKNDDWNSLLTPRTWWRSFCVDSITRMANNHNGCWNTGMLPVSKKSQRRYLSRDCVWQFKSKLSKETFVTWLYFGSKMS